MLGDYPLKITVLAHFEEHVFKHGKFPVRALKSPQRIIFPFFRSRKAGHGK